MSVKRAELGGDDGDLVVLHEALGYGHCHLALGIPIGGKYADVNTLGDLMAMPDWSEETPMRVVTGGTGTECSGAVSEPKNLHFRLVISWF